MLSAFTYSFEHEYVMSLNGLGLVLLPACVAEFALEFAHATTLTLASKIAQIKTRLFLFMDWTESEFIFNSSKYKAHPLYATQVYAKSLFLQNTPKPHPILLYLRHFSIFLPYFPQLGVG
jgi:hypothetical protein